MKHILFTLLCASTALAQVRVTKVDVLPLGTVQEWHAPEFSPDGRSLFITTSTYDGIWKYDLERKSLVQITAEPRSGYGFAVSPDGGRIAYRKTSVTPAGRQQELIVRSVTSGTSTTVASGKEVSLPSFAGGTLAYTMGDRLQVSGQEGTAGSAVILGIEATKISLVRDGKKYILDPLGKGSYIWPSLSPDRTTLVAVDMSRGAFVCNLEGRNVTRLGRGDAPTWTRDGRWLVYMDDRDDGHRLLSSDLWAVGRQGGRKIQLTATPDRMEMFPRCSPVDNRIVCSTPDGAVLLLQYEEGSR